MIKTYAMPLYKLDDFKKEWQDTFEPHSDEIITSDQGYVDVAQQIESMMLAGQLLQESRPNTRNLAFDYDNDESAYNDFSDPAAVDRRGSDITDVVRDADNFRDRVNQAYRNVLDKHQKETVDVKTDVKLDSTKEVNVE